jgi:C-terminal processing protease CtpA/Prc
MIDSVDPESLRGKSWAATVFTPMEHPYREGIWDGPLMVLVDGESWSASEEFAAILQDNRAALVIGEPTGGAGCGHTDGSEPVVLRNSGARLELPDCARIRADGSNEVRGVVPDLLIGWGRHDGPQLRASRLLAKLPNAIAEAQMTVRHKQ